MKKYIAGFVLPLIMIGCGGGGSSTTGVGYYKDSFVQGASYVCGSETGKTDSNGMFKFELNKPCSFSINSHQFKTVSADRLTHSGVTIQENDPLVARFLMTLDNNGNAGDLIQITDDVAKKVSKIPTSDTDFALLNALLRTVPTYDGSPISIAAAQEHLNESIGVMTAVATVSPASIKQGESITLSGASSTITRGEIASYRWSENGQRLSTEVTFSKVDFGLGSHTITLVIKDVDGNEQSDSVSFTVQPAGAATKWDGISPLSTNGTSQLFVTSDANNLYLLLKKDNNITDAQFFINTDDSNLSGLKPSLWPAESFDYVVKSDGMYHLLHATDYTGVKVQDITYTNVNNTLEIAIDKANIRYLAQSFGISVFFPADSSQRIPTAGKLDKFTDTFYNPSQVDTEAPIIILSGDNPLEMNVGSTFSDPGVSAQDIVEGAKDVVTDSSHVEISKVGYYTVYYTSSDDAGNVARASRIVKVNGSAPQSTLEVKDLGDLNESVVINHQTGLVWANDDTDEPAGGGSTRGCIIMVTAANAEELRTRFDGYCKRSNYAGFTDWRMPTPLELSKYTVQMQQEGKTPGMARKGCTRTLGVESDGTVKAVWTHNMNQPGMIETSTLTPSGGRCVRGPVDTSTGDFQLQELNGEAKDRVIVDTSKNLMWVNESNKSKLACLAIHFDKPAEYNSSQTFCAALDHANFTDWRDPTPAEVSDFILRTTNDAHILPGYEAPCKKLLARTRDANGTIVTEKEVYTRYNGSQLGEIGDLNITTSNIGLRCVRPTN